VKKSDVTSDIAPQCHYFLAKYISKNYSRTIKV